MRAEWSDRGRRWQVLAVALLVLYLVGSWFPFRLDAPFRADDVRVDEQGTWWFSGRARAVSDGPPAWLADAIDGGKLDVELEVRSDRVDQSGPARILAITETTSSHDLVVAQDGAGLVVRVRRPGADPQGRPAVVVPDVFGTTAWRRIGVSLAARSVEIVIDGRLVATFTPPGRTFEAWDPSHRLALGNDPAWHRGWAGAVRSATVTTSAGRVGLLTSDLDRASDGTWVIPARLEAEPERPTLQRVAMWALHGVFAACVTWVLWRAWPRRSPVVLGVLWAAAAVIVNLGKLVVDARHPSVVTASIQILGGVVGLWLTTTLWPDAVADHARTIPPG